MKAMLLAAGRGERLRPLTDTIPKPLITLAGKPLIVHLIESLHRAGIRDLVINHSWLGDQIVQFLGDGSKLGVDIQYSPEARGALNTGGGIFKALALLGEGPFIACNTDIWTDFDFSHLPGELQGLAHLVMVNNPVQHQKGDFALQDGRIHEGPGSRYTYSGIGLYRPELFRDCRAGAFALTPLLRTAISQNLVSGELHDGEWRDLGTAQRLADLERHLSGK